MSAKDAVVKTLEAGVRILRINRPKTKNAFNHEVYKTITDTLNEDANNDATVVTIITGTGDYYSSGFDIKSAIERMTNNSTNDEQAVKKMIDAFISYPKLLIAAINGPAIGIAVTTAALCDVVYASERATFHTPFLSLGLCAEGCSSYTFPTIMGRSKASEMIILGKKITAQEALQFGFVSQVIPHNQFEGFIDELKTLGGQLSVNSVKINKQLLIAPFKRVLCECNERETKQLAECFGSEEMVEAITKFMIRKSKL